MRNMSFSKTTQQIRDRTKTVTRRDGWTFLRPGDLVCAVEKGMGLRKGERVKRLATLRIVSVRREHLCRITPDDVAAEGFPGMQPAVFLRDVYGNEDPKLVVTRIEFEYVEGDGV